MTPVPALSDEVLGKIALERGFLTLAELADCLGQQERSAEKPSLSAILVQRGFLSSAALEQISKAHALVRPVPAEPDPTATDSLFGRILIQRRLVTVEQVKECLELQRRFHGEFHFPLRLGEIMVRRGYLTRRQVQDALKEQQKLVMCCEQCGTQVTVRHTDPTLPCLCERCGGRVKVHQDFVDARPSVS